MPYRLAHSLILQRQFPEGGSLLSETLAWVELTENWTAEGYIQCPLSTARICVVSDISTGMNLTLKETPPRSFLPWTGHWKMCRKPQGCRGHWQCPHYTRFLVTSDTQRGCFLFSRSHLSTAFIRPTMRKGPGVRDP